MSWTIRRLAPTDFAEWLRLRAALWPDATPQELEAETRDLLTHPDAEPVFVAERDDGRLGGMVEASLHETAPGCATSPVGYLEGWYVDPDLRRQGVGAALVAAAEEWARGNGCSEMASDTDAAYPLSPLAHARLGYEETLPLRFRKTLAR